MRALSCLSGTAARDSILYTAGCFGIRSCGDASWSPSLASSGFASCPRAVIGCASDSSGLVAFLFWRSCEWTGAGYGTATKMLALQSPQLLRAYSLLSQCGASAPAVLASSRASRNRYRTGFRRDVRCRVACRGRHLLDRSADYDGDPSLWTSAGYVLIVVRLLLPGVAKSSLGTFARARTNLPGTRSGCRGHGTEWKSLSC